MKSCTYYEYYDKIFCKAGEKSPRFPGAKDPAVEGVTMLYSLLIFNQSEKTLTSLRPV